MFLQTASLDIQREYILSQILEPVIVSAQMPRCAIELEVQVVQDDGGLLAAAVNAACLALLDAGVPCQAMIACVSIGVHADGSLVIDPDAKEEQACSDVRCGLNDDS
jgi:exosome complex component RRP46